MGRIQSLKETIFGVPEPTDLKKGTVIINPIQQNTWIRPATTFKEQIDVFNEDALVRQAALRQAEEIIGAGFFTQIDPKYTLKLPSPIKEIGEWNAKEAIDYLNEQNNMDEILQTVAAEMVAYGNSFISVTNGLKLIPLEAVEYAQPRAKDVPIKDEYDVKLTATYNSQILKWGSFIHFRANLTTNSAPFGQGLVAPLMQSYTFVDSEDNTYQSPTPLELRHSTRRSMEMGFRKFSFCNEMICVPEADDPTVLALKEKVKVMQPTGERIVTNARGASWILAVPQRTTSYDEWLKVTQAEFNALLEDPALKIHTETIFAKATAEEETKLFQKKVLSMQRVLKRQIEALWAKCLREWGFDPVKAKARMEFGQPVVPEYNIQDILKAVEQTVISKDEARQMLREARWKIVEGEAPKDKVPEPKIVEGGEK